MGSSVCLCQDTDSDDSSCAASEEERQVIHPPTYVSFLIRLWREPTSQLSGQTAGWQGEVEHIQSGRRRKFDGLDQLFATIRKKVEGLEEPE